jgi:hypothetical protein
VAKTSPALFSARETGGAAESPANVPLRICFHVAASWDFHKDGQSGYALGTPLMSWGVPGARQTIAVGNVGCRRRNRENGSRESGGFLGGFAGHGHSGCGRRPAPPAFGLRIGRFLERRAARGTRFFMSLPAETRLS